MKTSDRRSEQLALYIIENKATVRSCASHFGISKSTVHSDVTKRLRRINPALHAAAAKVLLFNKNQRHIRGGEATKRRWQNMNKG